MRDDTTSLAETENSWARGRNSRNLQASLTTARPRSGTRGTVRRARLHAQNRGEPQHERSFAGYDPRIPPPAMNHRRRRNGSSSGHLLLTCHHTGHGHTARHWLGEGQALSSLACWPSNEGSPALPSLHTSTVAPHARHARCAPVRRATATVARLTPCDSVACAIVSFLARSPRNENWAAIFFSTASPAQSPMHLRPGVSRGTYPLL